MTTSELAELKWLLRKAMARRSDRNSQCLGKQAFDNRVDAQRTIRSQRLKAVCVVYRCPFCDRWHAGSDVEGRKKRKAQRMVRSGRETA